MSIFGEMGMMIRILDFDEEAMVRSLSGPKVPDDESLQLEPFAGGPVSFRIEPRTP